ncbi:MAG: class I SAM-dependent methyltransferase [Pseudobdellovibrionaceae bacterium]
MSTFHKENETGYNACSSFYDSYLNPTVAIDELFFPQAFADVFHQNVLEVGCGTGRHTVRLLDAGNTVTGIDISEGMLSKLKEKIQDNKLTLIHGDFLTDHIPNAPFDSIVTSLVLEHIDDLNTFFSISRKVLKPFGYLYISDIHPERTASKCRFLLLYCKFDTGESPAAIVFESNWQMDCVESS